MFSTTETEEERCMDSLPQIPERNYRPHTYETRLHCCKRVRESRWPIRKVAQYYHVKKPLLYRWLKRYDQRGEGALRDLPHRPKSPHPASIPKGAAYKIKCLFNKSKSNGRDLGEGQRPNRLFDVLHDRFEAVEKTRWIRALQDEPQEALQEIPHAR